MIDRRAVLNLTCLRVEGLHVESEYFVIQASDATTGMEY